MPAMSRPRSHLHLPRSLAPMLLPPRLSLAQDCPTWAFFMGMEHERIHIETSSVLMRELPLGLLRRPPQWPAYHPSVCDPARSPPANAMITGGWHPHAPGHLHAPAGNAWNIGAVALAWQQQRRPAALCPSCLAHHPRAPCTHAGMPACLPSQPVGSQPSSWCTPSSWPACPPCKPAPLHRLGLHLQCPPATSRWASPPTGPPTGGTMSTAPAPSTCASSRPARRWSGEGWLRGPAPGATAQHPTPPNLTPPLPTTTANNDGPPTPPPAATPSSWSLSRTGGTAARSGGARTAGAGAPSATPSGLPSGCPTARRVRQPCGDALPAPAL